MGLYYNAFIERIKLEYKKSSNMTLEDFLITKKAQKIYKEFDVSEGSLTWALNLSKIFEDLDQKPRILKESINKTLNDNFKEWENDDFSYLIKKDPDK